MIASFEEIEEFARQQFAYAMAGANAIQFSVLESRIKSAEVRNIRASMITEEPEIADLTTSQGISAWAVILSVDLRGSSTRAVRVGAEHTFLTMHTYLPTMAELVARAGGNTVGLRGDGLFAAFGLTKLHGRASVVSPTVAATSVRSAANCGKSMVEAVAEILTPLLEANEIEGNLQVGVGIDVGSIVVTRIGLHSANEVTAYGPSVNHACKFSNRSGEIQISTAAKDMFPKGKAGKVTFSHSPGAYIVNYPPDLVMLERNSNPIQIRKAK